MVSETEKKDNYRYDLTVITVNYKVKEYLANMLRSIQKAGEDLSLQILVVDNASNDGSLEYLRPLFPEAEFIANEENRGFGAANNQALERTEGKYCLLINPDTVVSEDTLATLFRYMEQHPQCGASGCKILNPNGSFAPESRRSVPTIWSSACKVLGLSSLFPQSRIFGSYYMRWLEEDQTATIPVLSGSFMFFRTEVLKKLGGFDERFFMYGEDIDLCYRLNKSGYHIDYVPRTSIIHYKGESSRKETLRYIRNFNRALYLFYDKHYSSRYSGLFRFFIYLSVIIRTLFSFLGSYLKGMGPILADLLGLNAALGVAFSLRFSFEEWVLQPHNLPFLEINAMISVLYVGFALAFGLRRKERYSVLTAVKAVVAAFIGVIVITYFLRGMAYSRLILLLGGGIGVIGVGLYRLLLKNRRNFSGRAKGKLNSTRIIIVGLGDKTAELIRKLRARVEWDYEIIGLVSRDPKPEVSELENVPVIGSLAQLPVLVERYNADQVHFLLHVVSYRAMIEAIMSINSDRVITKLIPDSMDYMLGKSNVEYLADIPVIDLELAYRSGFNRLLKRIVELLLALPAWAVLGLLSWPSRMFRKHKTRGFHFEHEGREEELMIYNRPGKHRFKNWYRLLGAVIQGRLRLVGAPFESSGRSTYLNECGLAGLVQLYGDRIHASSEREQFDLYYLQNYSVWLDLDILVKTLIRGPGPLEEIERALADD